MMTIRFRSTAVALLVATVGLSACADETTSPLELVKAPVSADVDSAKKAAPTIPWTDVNSAAPTIPWTSVSSSAPTLPWN